MVVYSRAQQTNNYEKHMISLLGLAIHISPFKAEWNDFVIYP